MIDRFITSERGVSKAHFMRNTASAKRAILKNNSTAYFTAVTRDVFILTVDGQSPKKSWKLSAST
jgi:hypothetical protein